MSSLRRFEPKGVVELSGKLSDDDDKDTFLRGRRSWAKSSGGEEERACRYCGDYRYVHGKLTPSVPIVAASYPFR